MCWILEIKDRMPRLQSWVDQALQYNKDGFGLMLHFPGIDAPRITKGMKTKQLFTALRSRPAGSHGWLHVRFATHGETNSEMAHPFHILKDIYLMHNGVIHVPGSVWGTESDTAIFVRQYIRPMLENVPDPNKAIRQEWFRRVVEQMIGSGNRIVMMDSIGSVLFSANAWTVISDDLGNKFACSNDHYVSEFKKHTSFNALRPSEILPRGGSFTWIDKPKVTDLWKKYYSAPGWKPSSLPSTVTNIAPKGKPEVRESKVTTGNDTLDDDLRERNLSMTDVYTILGMEQDELDGLLWFSGYEPAKLGYDASNYEPEIFYDLCEMLPYYKQEMELGEDTYEHV